MCPKIKFKKLISKYHIAFDTDFSTTVDLFKRSLGMSNATNEEICARTNLSIRNNYLVVPWIEQRLLGYLNKNNVSKFLDKLEIKP